MPVQISILGLNRQSGSLAAALAGRADLTVVGYDPEPEVARAAHSRKLVQRTEWNLAAAVENADLVILAVPLNDQRGLMQMIGQRLRPGGVAASLAPLLGPSLEWSKALPADRHFVACHPTLNPDCLHSVETGLDAARPDLFTGGLWALAPAPACAPEALQVMTDLAALAGATAYFVDPDEHDGLMGGADALPVLLAWALAQAATRSPGWPDMRKVTNRTFAVGTAALNDADPAALSLNAPSVLRYLDAALAELKSLREVLAAGQPEPLADTLADAAERRLRWLVDRSRGEWEPAPRLSPEVPDAGERMGRMFFGGLLGRKRNP